MIPEEEKDGLMCIDAHSLFTNVAIANKAHDISTEYESIPN